MSLQLTVLSGSLCGRTFAFDQPEVWFGRDPACAVAFDPHRDDSVGRRHACIRKSANGSWSIENCHDNGTFLNGKPLTAVRTLRSGDVIRLAADGPEVRMTVIADEQPKGMVAPHPSRSVIPARTEPSSGGGARYAPWVFAGGFAVLVLVLVVVLLRQGSTPPTVVVSGGAGPGGKPRDNGGVDPPDILRRPPEPPKGPAEPEQKPAVVKPPAPSEEQVRRYEDAIVWLGVQAEGGILFVGTGWMFRPDSVVTTATTITTLEKSAKQAGIRIVAVSKRQNVLVPAKQFVIHPRYQGPERIHYNIGQIILEKSIPVTCPPQASESDLRRLVKGQELRILGFSMPDVEQAYSESNAPSLDAPKGRIESLRPSQGFQGGFPTLTLTISAPLTAEGAPVFNADSKVVGIFYPGEQNQWAVLCDRLTDLVR